MPLGRASLEDRVWMNRPDAQAAHADLHEFPVFDVVPGPVHEDGDHYNAAMAPPPVSRAVHL